MQKKQKMKSKKPNQRAFRGFIFKVKSWKEPVDASFYISNICKTEVRNKEISVHKLPIWRNVTPIQRLAYFFYFMSETKDFTSLKPFTLNLSKHFRERYKKLTYKKLKAEIIKKMYGNLDYIFQSSEKPMMAFILESKPTNKRKDINDKEIHIHGIRQVYSEDVDQKVRLALKTSVCNGKKEYKDPIYHNMLQTSNDYGDYPYGAKGWMRYINKSPHSNNGLYISLPLLDKIRKDYELLYKEYQDNIKKLKENGIKIKYIKPDTL